MTSVGARSARWRPTQVVGVHHRAVTQGGLPLSIVVAYCTADFSSEGGCDLSAASRLSARIARPGPPYALKR